MNKQTSSFTVLALVAGCAQQAPLQPRPLDIHSASCSKPDYPDAARRYDAQGTTQVSFVVDSQGVVSQLEVTRSSGGTTAHKALDQAALRALATCRFPASPGYGSAPGTTEYVWRLEGSQSYADRIRAVIKPNIAVSETIEGNPTAEIEVRTEPDGRIVSVKLRKASGSPHWDAAVQRAMMKVERLPLDINGRVPPVIVIALRPKS